jgi:hypothetical protein
MLDKKVLGRAKSRQIETDEEWNACHYNNRLNYRRRLAKLTPEELKKNETKIAVGSPKGDKMLLTNRGIKGG